MTICSFEGIYPAVSANTLLDKTPPSATHVDDVARIGLDGKAINWIWVRLAI